VDDAIAMAVTTAGTAAMPGTLAADCAGALAFGEIAACPQITGGETHVYTITTTKPNDKLFLKLAGQNASAQLLQPNGTSICHFGSYVATCATGPARTYTIEVTLSYGDPEPYSIAVESAKTPSSCTVLPGTFFSFASPGIEGALPAGSAGNCYRFNQPVGSVIYISPLQTSGWLPNQILDGNLEPVCHLNYARPCTLSTPGPYRLNVVNDYDEATTYRLKFPRLSNPAGCAVLKLAPFGDPGDAVSGGSLNAQDDIACHRIRMPSAGPVAPRIYDHQHVNWTFYDSSAQQVCAQYDGRTCALPAAGDYSLIVTSRGWGPITYQVSVPALFRNTGCAPRTGLSWALDAVTFDQTAPLQTFCQPFSGNAGDRIVYYAEPLVYTQLAWWLVNSAGEALCTGYSEQDGCVLPATGVYRIISHVTYWQPPIESLPYKVQVRRLSQPAGCPVIQPGTYNAVPTGALGPIRCRILNVTTPGVYTVTAFTPDNYRVYGSVYDSTGLRVCDDSGYCDLASGRYTMVLESRVRDSVIDNDFTYVTSFLPIQPAGCPQLGDGGFSQAPEQTAFTSPGQQLCREITSPAGTRLIMLIPSSATDGTFPKGKVIDATGNYVCEVAYGLWQTSCLLTGTAPFTLVLNQSNGDVPGPLTFALARVDGPPSCTALPVDPAGLTVNPGPGQFGFCFSVPADHAARESFTMRRLSGAGNATMFVFSDTGLRYCGSLSPAPERAMTCTLPAGPVTVTLHADTAESAYQLIRAQVP
jgi:hypothetical protein